MNSKLFNRRRRTLFLLAGSNSIPSIVASVSADFGCSQDAVYKDLKNIHRWGKDFTDLDYCSTVINGKFNLLYRDAMDSMLGCKDERIKHQARADGLMILKEMIVLGLQVGFINSQPREVNQTLSVKLPFEADGEIMEAYRKSAQKQRAERESIEGVKRDEGISPKETDEKPVG